MSRGRYIARQAVISIGAAVAGLVALDVLDLWAGMRHERLYQQQTKELRAKRREARARADAAASNAGAVGGDDV